MTHNGALGADYLYQPCGEELEWQHRALCRGMDSSIFFPEERNSSKLVRQAKQICLDCPVFRECRNWGLTHREQYGIWGGLSDIDRRRIWKRQRERVFA